MKQTSLIAIVILALQTAGFSQDSKTNQTDSTPATPKQKALSELGGAIYKFDATNKTVQICPWDRDAQTYRRDSIKVLSWEDSTRLICWTNDLTMAEFVGGKPLLTVDMFGKPTAPIKDSKDMRGAKFTCYIEQVGDKSVVRKMEMAAMFAGESMPAMVGEHGAIPFGGGGDGKVHFDDN